MSISRAKRVNIRESVSHFPRHFAIVRTHKFTILS